MISNEIHPPTKIFQIAINNGILLFNPKGSQNKVDPLGNHSPYSNQ